MNYIQVIEELFSRRHYREQSGFSAFCELSKSHSSYPTIHIAGTNGKGSVSLKIAKALELSGLKVGLYTSPHLESFCERIVINGCLIAEEVVRKGLLELFCHHKLCFFELATLLAFDYFAHEKVDVAVIEAGVGGREDATNVVTPLVSIITSIAKDHEDLLGPTLGDIAYQKAGIIKPGIPVVLGPTADYGCIHDEAKKCQSELYLTNSCTPFYDDENCAIAKQALHLLQRHFTLTDSCIDEALKIRPACRFEQVGRVILDVAHNPAGFHRLLEAFDYHFPHRPMTAVVGISSDKDMAACLRVLAERARHLFLVPSPALKAASVKEMGQILSRLGMRHFSSHSSIQEGVKKSLTQSDDLVVICGSFYIMKEARVEISQHQLSLPGRKPS
jgi:dihydrofolate synthase / folylpolyglutamate synthase